MNTTGVGAVASYVKWHPTRMVRSRNVGIMPITGIPLPFLTVGGSSMVANLLAVGVLQSIHARGALAATPRR